MKNNVEKGILLLADPFLLDSSFKRSVVLLVEHNDTGSVGFIVNKKMEIRLDQLLSEPLGVNMEVYYGGPVSTNSLYYIHRLGHVIGDSEEIGDGYSWGGDFEQIRQLFLQGRITERDIRFFVGYTGWGREQLATELNEKAWLLDQNKLDDLFIQEQNEELWRQKMTEKGSHFALWANLPDNPSLN